MIGITVDIEDMSHRYGDTTVLEQLNLHVPAGARHAVIGANGAGKTTLLGLIAGTSRPSTGSVHFGGRDVTHLPLHRRAQLRMSRTWQRPAVIEPLTAIDNVALALRGLRLASARRTAAALLAQAGLAENAHILAGRLPYGQRRVLELVTALASRPRLLVLDEPSAGLDDLEAADLLQRLIGVSDDTTILLTDHSRALVAAVADTVTVLERGQHLRTGPTSVVLRDANPSPATAPAAAAPVGKQTERNPSRARPVLEVSNLNSGYRDHHVLHDLDFTVDPGEIVAVVGLDGAGRTTLVDALAGTLPIWRLSRIILAGVDVTGLLPARRARIGLGTVPQRQLLTPALTVAEQLRIADVEVNGLSSELLALAPWLPRRLSQAVNTLSGGERQILAVTCALARQPKLLLLDEVTEGLATPVVSQLSGLLRLHAARGVGVLVTDGPSGHLAAAADRVLQLFNGHLQRIR
ncbi:ATP-binding cassette domain-containing protein [Dactylosporangium sp. NPDC050688]|uniref:ATP-binding cassette domain-containing protein n=1 Tax=Dactylosporangium sp. NPDC050688 TaxID=3157217 RepID=UPI0033C46392